MAWSPKYATSADLKAYLRIPDLDTVDDAQIALALEAASRAIDDHTHRQFGLVAAPEARYFTPVWDYRRNRYVVAIDDLMTVTGLVIALDSVGDGTYATTVVNADVQFLELNAAPKGKPWEKLILPASASVSAKDGSVRVTARWGWSTVPDAVKQVCLFQANRAFKRREAPFGISGSPDTGIGNELRLLGRFDTETVTNLAPYKRFVWGA